MTGIGYSGTLTDDAGRAKTSSASRSGRKTEPDTILKDRCLQRHNIITGRPQQGHMMNGGLFKRYVPGPVMDFVTVDDPDGICDRSEGLSGNIVMQKNAYQTRWHRCHDSGQQGQYPRIFKTGTPAVAGGEK